LRLARRLRDRVTEHRNIYVGGRHRIAGRQRLDLTMSGEINACERLVVEGSLQANLRDDQRLTITETGFFNGNAAIDEAEGYGRFEIECRSFRGDRSSTRPGYARKRSTAVRSVGEVCGAHMLFEGRSSGSGESRHELTRRPFACRER